MTTLASAYAQLGLSHNASTSEVKEAFRKLVWQHHPDKASPDMRATAEATFKEVKQAYEAILRQKAGYSPPPPGSAPNAAYAEAYWHTNSVDGRVPWGKYAGYETEMQFYRAWLRSGRNSLVALTVAGLLAIPAISTVIMAFQRDEESQWSAVREQGIDVLRQQHIVNGQVTYGSPFAAVDHLDTLAARKREAAARAAARQKHG